ncbi:MAG: hypothetical protein ACRDZX_14740 [Acidimicrobiales bacterium]
MPEVLDVGRADPPARNDGRSGHQPIVRSNVDPGDGKISPKTSMGPSAQQIESHGGKAARTDSTNASRRPRCFGLAR